MCNKNGNRELVCTVGDLTPGSQYRTPEGDTRLVLDQTARPCTDGLVRTVSIHNGMPIDVDPTTKLGRDRQDRLYASRFLNDPDCIARRDATTKAIMDLLP